MWEPSQGFAQEGAIPNGVIEYFSKYEIRLLGQGIMAGEPCVFLVLDPNVTILAHHQVPESHPEATIHLWAARISIPGGAIYRTLYSWTGSFLFLLVRPIWSDFPPTYSELIRRAREVEEGATPGPDLSAAKPDFERFIAKHREVNGPRDKTKVSDNPSPLDSRDRNEMRLIREYRRLATSCMQRLERIPC